MDLHKELEGKIIEAYVLVKEGCDNFHRLHFTDGTTLEFSHEDCEGNVELFKNGKN